MGIFTAIIILSFLIFFHELGHFTVARFFGVRVNVFSIGFGKKLFSRQIGQTLWTISAIPLGGYVQMKGQNDADPSQISYDEDSYAVKKPWQRILILLAGPFANFFLAFLLYFSMSIIGIPKPLADIGSISKDSPAQIAGLQQGDKILKVNGQNITFWQELSPAISKTQDNISLMIERNATLMSFTLKPKLIDDKNMFGETIQRRIIGIAPLGTKRIVHYHVTDAIIYAWEQTKQASLMIVESMQKMLTGVVSPDQVGGIISIVDVTAEASNASLLALLFFTALISVNLGVLNLLPIPALDGGHIMFNLYEMFTGKTASEQVMMTLTIIGWGLLLSLMMLGFYNDINRLIG
ncbi:Membrane-associated zinc metalloprotease [hydrothermal vent metagenome]|uniref:Membrane-associated zinc metalloprotease n=1 Tax=hydrothermal vent metagenome TaxID=652676 RepID=A0A1W1D0P5_9ZZZZ